MVVAGRVPERAKYRNYLHNPSTFKYLARILDQSVKWHASGLVTHHVISVTNTVTLFRKYLIHKHMYL